MKLRLFNKPKVAHWHRFDHKNYSAFRSLGRVIAIGVITVATVNSATAVAAPGDAPGPGSVAIDWDDGGAVDLDNVEVTGSVKSLAAGRKARVVAVITRDDIAAAAAQSPADVLKMVSGVDVRQRGGHGVQNDIGIDGGTHDQVTIMLNGVNISSPQIGHYSSDWPVALDDIDRIEVLEGAASRIMGGSSLMGAINIITKPSSESHVSVGAEGGSYGSAGAEAQAALALRSVRQQASGGFRRSDGGTVNSGYSRGQAYYQGAYDGNMLSLDWQAGFSTLSHGANTFYSAAYPNQHDALNRYLVSATAATKGRFRVEPQIYWQRISDHYQLVKDTDFGENFHYTDAYGGRINAFADWAAGTTTIGAELRHESIYSSAIGKPLPEDEWKPVRGRDGKFYSRHDSRTNLGYYLEHNASLRRCNISAGLVAVRNTGLDKKLRFYPGIDFSYTPSRAIKVYTSWSRAFRMPTFTDLYYKSPTHEGNRDLRPERMTALQAGVVFFRPVAILRANLFWHHGKNMLDWVMFTPDDVYHSTGFDLDNLGASAFGELMLDQWLGSRQPLRRFSASYTYMHQHRRDHKEIYKSNYALEYLRHKFTATLTMQLCPGLTASLSMRWQHRSGNYIIYRDAKPTGELHPYSPYAVLDMRLDYTFRNLLLYVDATNITNHRYYDFGNIPQPGIWVMAGAKLKFKL